MKTFWLPILFAVVNWSGISAQTVINTEAMRLKADTQRIRGALRFDFGMSRNKSGRFLRPGLSTRIEFHPKASRYMFLAEYALTEFTDVEEAGQPKQLFNNRGFAHFRYNRDLHAQITWEAFTQYQFDLVQEIDLRILIGTGCRWALANQNEYFVFLGSLYMYEYEKTSAEEKMVTHYKHHRLSNYLSAGCTFNDYVQGTLTTYFQPRIDQWSDCRISLVSSIQVKLTDAVGLAISGNYIYDTQPPTNVPKSVYDLRTGLTVSW